MIDALESEQPQEEDEDDLSALEKVRTFLYLNCLENIRSYSETLVNEEDPYRLCPLINIYLFIINIAPHLEDVSWDGMQDRKQSDIPYCVDNQLIVSHTVPISEMNLTELLNSLDRIELRMNYLPYKVDLLQYLGALEMRAHDILLYSQSKEVHCIENCRLPVSGKPDQFVCRTSAEYGIILRILSIRHDLMGALPSLRDHDDCYRPPNEEEEEMVPLLHNNLLYECQMVHGDSIQNIFYKAYQINSLLTSEGYFWLKENPQRTITDCGIIIAQFRGDHAWRSVADKSSKDIDAHFYHLTDHLAFRLIFYNIMDMLLDRCVNQKWAQYFISNHTLKTFSDGELEDALMRSCTVPLFVESFNDACIFFNGKMYVFGNNPLDWLRALYNWVMIIQDQYQDILAGGPDIFLLKEILFSRRTKLRIDPIKYSGGSTFNDDLDRIFSQSKQQLERAQAQKRLSFVTGATASNEIQVTGIQQDLVDMGLLPSSSSAWD